MALLPRQRAHAKTSLFLHDQLLVAWKHITSRVFLQAGLLAYRSAFSAPSRFPSGFCGKLPAYSDEFVQDFHLFPFSPEHIFRMFPAPEAFLLNSICIILLCRLSVEYEFGISGTFSASECPETDHIFQPGSAEPMRRLLVDHFLPDGQLASGSLLSCS